MISKIITCKVNISNKQFYKYIIRIILILYINIILYLYNYNYITILPNTPYKILFIHAFLFPFIILPPPPPTYTYYSHKPNSYQTPSFPFLPLQIETDLFISFTLHLLTTNLHLHSVKHSILTLINLKSNAKSQLLKQT